MIEWYVEGVEFGNCNCDWCFPCQAGAPSGRGACAGFEVVRIDRGHFGDVDLAGLNMALLYAWPGALLEGEGEILPIVDRRASPAQRNALATILLGGHTQEAMTHWWVFHAMSRTVHEPVDALIDFDVDPVALTARIVIPGIIEATGRPVLRRHAGAEHQVLIEIPKGCDVIVPVPGTPSRGIGRGAIELDLHDCFGQFSFLCRSGTGAAHRA